MADHMLPLFCQTVLASNCSLCQFHQRYTPAFFVRTSFSLVTCKLPKWHSQEKFVRRTLMKLLLLSHLGVYIRVTDRPQYLLSRYLRLWLFVDQQTGQNHKCWGKIQLYKLNSTVLVSRFPNFSGMYPPPPIARETSISNLHFGNFNLSVPSYGVKESTN